MTRPVYYRRGRIEVWDFIVDQELDFLLGNVIKYVCRAGAKGSKREDLLKARAYIDKALEECGDGTENVAHNDTRPTDIS